MVKDKEKIEKTAEAKQKIVFKKISNRDNLE